MHLHGITFHSDGYNQKVVDKISKKHLCRSNNIGQLVSKGVLEEVRIATDFMRVPMVGLKGKYLYISKKKPYTCKGQIEAGLEMGWVKTEPNRGPRTPLFDK